MSVDDYRQSTWLRAPADSVRPGAAHLVEDGLGLASQSPSVVGVLVLTAILLPFLSRPTLGLAAGVGNTVAVALAAPADYPGNAGLPLPLALPILLVLSTYLGPKLFVVTPEVMLDGSVPGRALTRSWDLMDGSLLPTFVALAFVLTVGVTVGVTTLLFTGSELVTSAVLSAVTGASAVGAQVSRYADLIG